MEYGARVSSPAAMFVFGIAFGCFTALESMEIAAGGETRAPWVKTRTDRGISFRLDTKVVPEYPVKALCA